MKAVEIPDHLVDLVEASGVELDAFVIEAVQERLLHPTQLSHGTLGERIKNGWVPPTVRGTARPDGVPWSEIEAPCDPA